MPRGTTKLEKGAGVSPTPALKPKPEGATLKLLKPTPGGAPPNLTNQRLGPDDPKPPPPPHSQVRIMQTDRSGDIIDDQMFLTLLYKRLGGIPLGGLPLARPTPMKAPQRRHSLT